MADIADIVIRVDSTQLVGASTATQGLQKNTLGLLASLSRAGAASLQYQKEVKLLQDAERQSIVTSNELSRSLRQLELRYNSMGLAVDSAGNLIESAQGRANQFGHNIQQVGYQVGDFFVQIQSGTNFLVAFGQQATQLAGLVPGALGAALGIGISLFSAIGATLMRSSESAGTFQDALGKANDTISETSGLVKIASGDLEELIEKFGGVNSAVKALVLTGVDISLRQLSETAKGLRDELTELYSGSVVFNVSRAEDLSSAFDLNSKSARVLSSAIEDLAKQETLQAQLDSATKLRELFLSMVGPVNSMNEAEFAYYLSLRDAEEVMRELLLRTVEVADAAEGIDLANTKDSLEFSANYLGIITERALSAAEAADKINLENAANSAEFAASYMELVAERALKAAEAAAKIDLESAAKSAEFAGNYIELVAERALDAAEAAAKISFSNATAEAAALANELERAAKQAVAVGGGRGMSAGGPELDPYGFRAQLEKDKAGTSSSGGGGGGISSPSRLKEEIKLTKELTEAEKERQGILETVNGSLETGFLDMVKGTKTVGEAFRSMAAAIIEELFRVLVVQKLVGGITSAFGGGGFTNAQAGRLTGGGRASGGSMMAGQSYLVGEQGPEIVVPRHSGTVVNAKQTAGAMANSGSFTQNLSINVTGSDAAMVRQEVAKMIPQITNATKAAVIDAKQRGGQMAAAFR